MSNVARLSPDWQKKKNCCKVIIETPKGRRSKFDYDESSGLFKLGGLLPEGLSFPFDFGFVPGTRGDDGDPLDVLVLMEEPAHVGCLLDVRIVGVIEAEQIEDKKRTVNDRLIGVAIHSYSHEDIANIDQVMPRCWIRSRSSLFPITRVAGNRSVQPDGMGRSAQRR